MFMTIPRKSKHPHQDSRAILEEFRRLHAPYRLLGWWFAASAASTVGVFCILVILFVFGASTWPALAGSPNRVSTADWVGLGILSLFFGAMLVLAVPLHLAWRRLQRFNRETKIPDRASPPLEPGERLGMAKVRVVSVEELVVENSPFGSLLGPVRFAAFVGCCLLLLSVVPAVLSGKSSTAGIRVGEGLAALGMAIVALVRPAPIRWRIGGPNQPAGVLVVEFTRWFGRARVQTFAGGQAMRRLVVSKDGANSKLCIRGDGARDTVLLNVATKLQGDWHCERALDMIRRRLSEPKARPG